MKFEEGRSGYRPTSSPSFLFSNFSVYIKCPSMNQHRRMKIKLINRLKMNHRWKQRWNVYVGSLHYWNHNKRWVFLTVQSRVSENQKYSFLPTIGIIMPMYNSAAFDTKISVRYSPKWKQTQIQANTQILWLLKYFLF